MTRPAMRLRWSNTPRWAGLYFGVLLAGFVEGQARAWVGKRAVRRYVLEQMAREVRAGGKRR
jgi:hypothetical protein